MPIPKPDSGETEKEFIPRCVRAIIDEYDRDQALGICYSQLKMKQEMSKKKELYIIQPRKSENRGKYLSRCSNNGKMKKQFPNMKERMGFCLNTFNEYYSYWSKLEFSEVPENTALGNCIAKKKAQGYDYKQAYAECASKVVVPSGTITMGDDLLVEPVEFAEMDVLGYQTKYFYICPGAQATFDHLISMNPDEETAGMVRSAAIVADKVFEIEAQVIKDEKATEDQLNTAQLLVQDFYDIIEEIDEELGMIHDVSYMDGHIEKISSYL